MTHSSPTRRPSDLSVFDDGDALKLDRENARRHLSFGYGVHRCGGARLAELQLRILLEEMAARRMRVKVPGEPERVHACFVHGFRALPVQIEKSCRPLVTRRPRPTHHRPARTSISSRRPSPRSHLHLLAHALPHT